MLKIINRIINLCGNRKKRLYVGFLYTLLNSIFAAMPIMGVAYAINFIMKDTNGEITLSINHVLLCFGFMVFVIAGRIFFTYLIATTQESIGYEMFSEQRLIIGDTLKRVPMGFFSKKDIGAITSVVTNDVSFVENFAMKFIDRAVNGYISAIVMPCCLMIFEIRVGLIAICGVILFSLLMKYLTKKSRNIAPARQKSQEKLVSVVIEYIRGVHIVKAFKQDGIVKKGIKSTFEMSRKVNCKIERNFIPVNSLSHLVLKIASVGIILVSVFLTLYGEMKIAIMIMMITFSFIIYSSVEQISSASHTIQLLDVSLDRIEAIKNAKFIDEDSEDIKLTSYDICFKNVTFGYDKRAILKDISFNIPENKTTAIIGPSGGGKSTICSLIARFYDVSSGKITVGGVDIKNITCDSLLRNISMVFQKVYLFHDTIFNNICFGKPGATFEEVVEAAKKACCHEFIMNFPNGYDTVIGEGGSTLSGGEKQHISITRAILKNAPIIILDEATASIDPENEYFIQQAISSLINGKTIIIIAHRLATIENADQILVISDGHVTQKGTHDELLKQNGIYKNFLSIRKKTEKWILN